MEGNGKDGNSNSVKCIILFTVTNDNYIKIAQAIVMEKEWEIYSEVVKNSLATFAKYDSNSDDKVVKTITSKKDLLIFLQKNFSKLNTNIGTTEFTFEVLENDKIYYPYDYWMQAIYDYNYFEGAINSIKYTKQQKDTLRQELKDHMERLGNGCNRNNAE